MRRGERKRYQLSFTSALTAGSALPSSSRRPELSANGYLDSFKALEAAGETGQSQLERAEVIFWRIMDLQRRKDLGGLIGRFIGSVRQSL